MAILHNCRSVRICKNPFYGADDSHKTCCEAEQKEACNQLWKVTNLSCTPHLVSLDTWWKQVVKFMMGQNNLSERVPENTNSKKLEKFRNVAVVEFMWHELSERLQWSYISRFWAYSAHS